MIELLGPEDGDERRAAEWLQESILQLWPDLANHSLDKVRIHAAAKLFGYPVQDLDLLLLAAFGEPRTFRPATLFHPRDEEPILPRTAAVRNLALVIEVKGHGAEAVRFDGLTAQVRYRRGGEEYWENASEQSHKQLHALLNYFRDQKLSGIFLTNLILFPNLREDQLPGRPHNMIGGDAGFAKILNVLGEISHPWIRDGRAQISAGKAENIDALFRRPLFRSLEPTSIDRKRMDRIARKAALNPDWLNDLGEREVIFRGRGGAGKTVILLQLAYRAFDEQRARSLVLTYNRALIADIRRTMALFGMPSNVANGGIRIDSVMSFIGRVLQHFGLIGSEEDFLENYGANCTTLAELLANGDIPATEVAAMKRDDPANFAFDHVFVDEGQDWPDAEICILRAIYPPELLIIADGVDQFVRGSVADWTTGVDSGSLRVRRLRRCLRMKSNLAAFANTFAAEVGLEAWSVEPNTDAGGGRILIVEGDYLGDLSLHDQLVAEASASGNAPVDLLLCIPPTLVVRDGGVEASRPAQALTAHGLDVWDGAIQKVRQDFPRRPDQFRIVQYESCRGLEGWTVFALGFDEFWAFKFSDGLRSAGTVEDLFRSPEDMAQEAAARWAMIAMTRAIDSLVIQISPVNTPIRTALQSVADRHPDFVEW